MSFDVPLLKVDRKVTFTVRGKQYDATIDGISAHAADSRSWQKNDELHVLLSFEHAEGKFPGSTLGFGLTLPVKEYKPEELMQLIQLKGNIELEKFTVQSEANRAYYAAKESRQNELNEYASRITDSLKS